MKRFILFTDDASRRSDNLFDIVHWESFPLENVPGYECAFIALRAPWKTLDLLLRLRGHAEQQVYLKPVFLLSDFDKIDPFVIELLDGVIHSGELHLLLSSTERTKTSSIILRSEQLGNQAAASSSAVRVLRWMYTRQRPLNSVTTSTSIFGFTYPFLAAQFDRNDFRMFEIPKQLAHHHLLESKAIDRIHECHTCRSSFINFRETCPTCQSVSIKASDLIHHFVCGNMGPIADYGSGDILTCPKCRKTLRHLGVDYDRPSIVFDCEACGEPFQQPHIQCTCINCGTTTDPEKLIQREVMNYSLTVLGENSAVSAGVFTFHGLGTENPSMVSLATFYEVVRIELERGRRYQHPPCALGIVRLTNYIQIHSHIGAKIKSMFEEMVKVIRSVVRPTDVIGALNESTLLLLLLDTSEQGSAVAMGRIKYELQNLMTVSLGIVPEINTGVIALDIKLTVPQTIDRALTHV
jgi:GGDEF domain-containing protein